MRLPLLALAFLLAAGTTSLLADDIPYGNPGHLAPAGDFCGLSAPFLGSETFRIFALKPHGIYT